MDRKAEMLACHASQREWLLAHHGMDEYIDSMRRHAAMRGGEASMAAAEAFVQHRGHAYPRDDMLADYSVPQPRPLIVHPRTNSSVLNPQGRPSMTRPLSKVAPEWWDYTTLDPEILADAARLTGKDLQKLSRPGFQVVMYDTLEEFYLAEALEYIHAWRQSTADNPAGICGPIGPTEQLPLVARLVNDLDLDVRNAHFWGMDEWVDEQGTPVPDDHPLSFARADRELCFDRIRRELADAGQSSAFSHRRSGRVFGQLTTRSAAW